MRNTFKFVVGAAAATLALGMSASVSSAASLGLNPNGVADDKTSTQLVVKFPDATSTPSGALTVKGTDFNGSFSLTAFITSAGTIDASKTSTLDVLDSSSNPLYHSTTLQKFGFSTSGSPGTLEFIFGSGTGTFGSLGPIGVKITNIASYPYSNGDFTQSFTSTANATADTFTVPLPPAALAGLCGLGLASVFMRRRKV